MGAGALTLATDGALDHCKIELGDEEFEDITVEVPVLTSRLDAAIWRPEKATDGDVHNTIVLSLIDPRQNEEADGGSGAGGSSAAQNITAAAGTWGRRTGGRRRAERHRGGS